MDGTGGRADHDTFIAPSHMADRPLCSQYPEGLYMLIWKDHLSGDVQVINGLNHYIGMKHISEDMFPRIELHYLCIVWNDQELGSSPFSIRRVWMLWTHAVLLISAAGLALYDFTNGVTIMVIIWIQTQPYKFRYELPTPVAWAKKLLNFDAWSTPGQGGWFILAGAVLVIGALLLEYFYFKKGLIHLHEMRRS